ncbi:hypothetical protein [Neisseria sp.]|uniref:hypothetical protein n=1 Tax=Neisseria sp. TaxID=192066 RepID=UPI0026DB841F|nr:hypothetical protein [Neisseria sp.]MDO4907224.1 hypothetical protein [Neisseria sp.]
MEKHQSWGADSKTIEQLIRELKTFEDQQLVVMVSGDGGDTLKPVKLLGKEFKDGRAYCTLFIEE